MTEVTRTRRRDASKKSWAEPWKIKMVEQEMVYEPKYLRFFQARFERL